MTSIVITPFDSEHTEELKEFLWKVIERADFAECMPPSVRLVDVQLLEAQRDTLLKALRHAVEAIDYYDKHKGAPDMMRLAHEAIQLTEMQ